MSHLLTFAGLSGATMLRAHFTDQPTGPALALVIGYGTALLCHWIISR